MRSIGFAFLGCAVIALTSRTASADPLLEVHDASLTTYVPASVSPVQGVRPLVEQRGTGIDGMVRARSLSGLTLHANPFESTWTNTASVSGVRVASGTFAIEDVDLAFPAEVPWVIGRTYNARQKDSGGSYIASDGYQGRNWFQTSQPELVFHDSATDSEDMIYLVYGADRYIEFRRGDDVGTGDSADTFRAVNGAAGAIVIETVVSGPDLATYTDPAGRQAVFFWFGDGDTDDDVEGQIWKILDPAGNASFVGHETDAATAISSGYDTATGAITTAYDSAGRRFSYTHDGTTGRLLEVDAEVNPGSWSSIGSVTYAYYVNADAHGQDGDLKTVTRSIPLSDGSSTVQKYYRYYEDTYNATTNPGYHHQLKYVYEEEGVRRYDWAGDSNFDGDHLSANDDDLKPYAAAYFAYDTDRRVVATWSSGQCGCSGAASGLHTFTYGTNGSFSGTSGYDTGWYGRAVVQKPTITQRSSATVEAWTTLYWDETGQALTRVQTDGDPSGSPSVWVTHAVRDGDGMVSSVHTPANVSSYSHATGAVTLSASAGLVHWLGRVAAGDTAGLPYVSRSSTGTSGSKYLDRLWTYVTSSFTTGDATIVRALRGSDRWYTQPITLGTSGSQVRTTTYTFHTGGSAVLAVKSATVSHPVVSAGENGSGAAVTSAAYYRKDGTPAFRRAEDGIHGYTRYVDGRLVEQIADVILSGSFVAGDDPATDFGITETSAGSDRTTTYAYDAQGRPDTVTLPDGRVRKTTYGRLADERRVTLRYADYDASPETFHGPVSYLVANLAGKTEAQATVALAGNESTTAVSGHVDETDDDPITAMDLGSVVRLSTMIHDQAGTMVQESRLYFEIPASGAGIDGTNYDATTYAYNDLGMTARTVAPHGTIQRAEYDTLGRTVAQWMGTNDSDWDEGSPRARTT